jgi:hypothetical protein
VKRTGFLPRRIAAKVNLRLGNSDD